jgi:hypothetical protein
VGETHVKIIPALDDPKIAAAAAEALDRRNDADYGCYMALRELLECDDVAPSSARDEAQECVNRREAANEEFCLLISGHKDPS